MSDQRGFFELVERYAALSKAVDPLERLSGVVDFEVFRPVLDAALKRSDGSKGGRAPMDPVRIMDRRTFEQFPGVDDGDPSRTGLRSGGSARLWFRRVRWRSSSPASMPI